eukprot:1145922-Pelagomonas_calceolata.AAC.3
MKQSAADPRSHSPLGECYRQYCKQLHLSWRGQGKDGVERKAQLSSNRKGVPALPLLRLTCPHCSACGALNASESWERHGVGRVDDDMPREGGKSCVPTTRRPPLRRNTTSAFLGRRLERSIQIPARRATYQGPEKGSLLDDVAEEESEGLERDSSWQDMIAKRSLFSRTTESRRTEATSQWTAAYAR